MKTKFIFTFIILLSITFITIAKEVDKKLAQKAANNFYFERNFADTKLNYSTNFVRDIYLEKIDSKAVLYHINYIDNGWVIVSASDGVIPIIAYSFKGSYSPGVLPTNFKAWVSQYKSQIFEVIDDEVEPTTGINSLWQHYLSDDPYNFTKYKLGRNVEPLILSSWDQGIYYNEMCPSDAGGPGGHCYTGCVPTCMGQICNYFRWPQSGVGSYTYDGGVYGELSADFSNSNYNWNEMPAIVSENSLETAQILYHLGVSCDLVYGPDGSGMYNHKAAYSLRTFFKYSPETEYLYRDSTNLNWDSVIVAHLDQKIPLYYAGWSVPNINGHAFVCDGYEDSNYFHFNWGWSGSNDGYFYTGNLNPGGNNFNLAQELIINCFPDTSNYSYPLYCTGNDTLLSTTGTINDGSGPIYNYQENTTCTWLISPSDSVNSITLDFINFNTEINDTLYVYDGNSDIAQLLGAFAGNTTLSPLTSSGDELFIKFVCDSQNTEEGWMISYHSEIPLYCSNNVLTELQGDLSDGSGSANYQNLTTCLWMIQPPSSEDIELIFYEFDTEQDHDFVTVYDGSDKIGEFSGSELPLSVFASSGMMTIVFSTNSSITNKGWKASYIVDGVGESEINVDQDIVIYPNPANTTLYIKLKENLSNVSIKIYSLLGDEVKSIETSNYKEVIINTVFIPNGLYILEIDNGLNKVCKKVTINH